MNQPMELDVWKGDWGLPSIDMECLRVINLSPDHGLTEKQKGDIVAFTMFLKDYLNPALQYVWWVDQRNWENLTRKWWTKSMPFPLGMILPNCFHKAAVSAVESLYPHVECDQMLEKEIYDRAESCFAIISQRLGTQEFMFGAHPTSIDATLFAYLAPLVKAPFPSSYLKNQVIGYNNLLKYITRISQRYFAAENQAYEAEKQQIGIQPGQADDNAYGLRYQILAGVFAVIAMGGYAVGTGLVQVEAAGTGVGNMVDTDDDN